MQRSQYDKVLETYSLDEILEWNNITEEEALEFLVTRDFLSLPNPRPIDCD